MPSTPRCARIDPDAIRERMRQEDRRHVDVIAIGDGTAKVDGVARRRSRDSLSTSG